MNRRSFLKSVGKTFGGVLGVGAVGLPKAKSIPDTIITANCTDAVQEWNQLNYFDFSPDEIVSFEVFNGRFFVICKHSIWEIFEDYDGMLSKKGISFIGKAGSQKNIIKQIVTHDLR